MKNPPLHRAAKAGDLIEMRRLLDAGADIEAVDELSGHTPLTRVAAGYRTQVFRLHTGTMAIERVETSGESSGWIHSHTAVWDRGLIRISGGKVIHSTSDGESGIEDLEGDWALDIAAGQWLGPG